MSVLTVILLSLLCTGLSVVILIAFLFAIYALINRKTLKLGYSEMPATILDLIIITLIPFVLTGLFYVTLQEIITKIML